MNLQRITRLHVLGIGAGAVVAVALIFLFLFVLPQSKRIRTTETSIDDTRSQIISTEVLEQQKEAALEGEQQVIAEFDQIVETRMPKDLEFSDEVGSTVRMWYFSEQEQELMEGWFASTGAQVSGWGFPTFGLERHDPTRRMLDPLSWNLTVTVKDFPALLEWLKKLPEAPRLMQLGSVSIHGPRQPGQRLTASVPVTVYMWTGVDPAPAAVAPAEGAAGPGGPGAGRGRGERGGRGRGMGGPRGF